MVQIPPRFGQIDTSGWDKDTQMGIMQSRSDNVSLSAMSVRAVAMVVLGMVLVVLGVAHGALFLPGVWVLIVGFIALLGISIYAIIRAPA